MDDLYTPRIRLRPMTRKDLRPLQGLYGDAGLMRYITGRPRTPLETRARLKKDLRHHRDHGFGLCIAESRETGTPIGRCGLEPSAGTEGLEGELAWMFAPEWWGQGLATEAGAALISFGLDDLRLTRVFAEADRRNKASLEVMEKLGMVPTRTNTESVEYESRP